MKHSAPAESKRKLQGLSEPDASAADEVQDEDFKPLSREEAARWRTRQPRFTVWRVVQMQAALALLGALLAWSLFGPEVAKSVFYGALCVVVPSAVMAWGLTSNLIARLFPGVPRASLASLLLWEGAKVLLVMAMLWSAPRWVPDLNWLALLAGLVVALKAYWVEFFLRTRTKP
jgi:ATP synthase protein I